MDHHDYVELLRPAGISPGASRHPPHLGFGAGVGQTSSQYDPAGLRSERWADLGAGSGAFTLALRELIGLSAEVYAVDRDKTKLAMLEQAHQSRFGSVETLHLIPADFTDTLELPPLDGVLMANSLHFYRDKEKVLRHIGTFLRPSGMLLLVEYNVDRGNPWVPHPLSFETFCELIPRAGFSRPRLLAKKPSSFLREFYSAVAYK